VIPSGVRLAHVDLWIRNQLNEGAADTTVARRVAAVSSWYKYMTANTADDLVPIATRNPTVDCAKPKIDQDYSPTVGLSQAEADRLIAAADDDTLTVSAFVRTLLYTGLRVGSVMDSLIEDLGYDSGHRVLNLIRKGGHRDRVAIPPGVGEPLDKMLAQRGNPSSGLLFLTTADLYTSAFEEMAVQLSDYMARVVPRRRAAAAGTDSS